MKIFITGVTGFIGSNLVKSLKEEIYGLVRVSHKKEKHEGYISIFGDMRDYNTLMKTIKDIKPEIVIHLAGPSSVSQSFEKPLEYFEVNTLGTINLAEINRKYNPNLKSFIWAGTCYEYGLQKSFPIKEDAPLNPCDPYSCSKVAASKYLLYMYYAYKFPVIISRHGNTFGRKSGEFRKLGVIENIITQMLKGNEIFLGSSEPIRDFLYADDVVNWYNLLIERGEAGEIYNAGWGKGYSIKEVVELAKEVTDSNSKIHWDSFPKRPCEIPKIILDINKAKEKLGWKPRYSLKEGLIKVRDCWKDVLE